MATGIVSYGNYVPKHRIDVMDIFKVWRNVTPEIFNRMSLMERAVLMPDEDSITLAVAAAQSALDRSGLKREDIGDDARKEKAAALAELAASRFSVLIGPAGTGKTTLVAALCRAPEIKEGGILLLAPTG